MTMLDDRVRISHEDSQRKFGKDTWWSAMRRVRYLQVAFLFLCGFILYMVRGCMSVAILAMITPTNDTTVEVYKWNESVKGTILSSFYWGYTAFQIPAGILAKRFGGHPLLLISLTVNGILCLLLPVCTKYGGWMAVCGVRATIGLTQAFLVPCTHTILGKWAPPDELTRMGSFAYTGLFASPILTMPLCGVLLNSSQGWKMIFYCMGALSLTTAVLWAVLSASSPAQHRFISHKEKSYIEKSLKSCRRDTDMPIPWGQILTSKPLFGTIAAHVGFNWGFMFFLTDTPAYFKAVLKVDISSSSSMSALPFVAKGVLAVVFSFSCEYIYNRRYLSVTVTRKLFNSIGAIGTAVGLISVSFLDARHGSAAVSLVTVAAGVQAAMSGGFYVPHHVFQTFDIYMAIENDRRAEQLLQGAISISLIVSLVVKQFNHIDLSPNFCGVLSSITNFWANMFSIAEPVFTSYVLGDNSTVSRWRAIFFVGGGFTLLTNLIFVIFGSGERQTWDSPPTTVHDSLHYDEFQKVNYNKEEVSYDFETNIVSVS